MQAQAFLEGPDDIENIESMRHANELFAQMRNLFQKLEQNARNITSEHKSAQEKEEIAAKEGLARRKTMAQANGVGDLDVAEEFGIGLAPKTAKPVSKIEISKQREEESPSRKSRGRGSFTRIKKWLSENF